MQKQKKSKLKSIKNRHICHIYSYLICFSLIFEYEIKKRVFVHVYRGENALYNQCNDGSMCICAYLFEDSAIMIHYRGIGAFGALYALVWGIAWNAL